MEYATEEIEAYFGILCGEVVMEASGFSVVQCTVPGAEKVATGKTGNVFAWKINIGKGSLYFGTFADFNCPDDKLEIMQSVLKQIGEASADVICTNPNISFTERITEQGTVIDVLNMRSNGTQGEAYELVFQDGRTISGTLLPCELKQLKLSDLENSL